MSETLVREHRLSVRRACRAVGLSRAAWYRPPGNWLERDAAVIEALQTHVGQHPLEDPLRIGQECVPGIGRMRARLQLVHLLVAGVLPWLPGDVRAACNVIPAAQGVFRGDAGSLDRPFARPGDVVEIAPDASCAARPRRLARRAKAHVVTIAWRAPDRPTEIVVLAPSCRVLASRLRRCRARSDVGRVTCLNAHLGRGLRDLERHEGPDGARRLRFRFPDTDALVGTAGDGLTLAGPAAIAVTRRGKALPCELASTPCESMQGVVACVDTLRARNGTCDRSVDATFPSFTALPPANDFAALCHDPTPPCRSTPGDARFTLDAAGNVLLPMSWRSVLVDSEAVPVPRLLRATIRLPAFPGGATPVRVPGASFLASFSPEGSRLPPIFDPQRDGEETNALTLFGSVDAPETVLRMARRAPAASDGTLVLRECHGGRDDGLPCAGADDCLDGVCDTARCTAGTRTGLACAADAECPDGECGRGLFDLRDLAVDGGGPHLAAAAALDVRALEAVPLDGLIRGERLYAFVVSEPLVGADVNGDGDRVDDVLTIRDRLSGDGRPVGRNGTAGRALVRVREPPFSFPAVDVAGDVVAFLESETTEGASDRTGDGDLLDGLLRVVRLDAGTVTDLVGDSPITGDTARRVNGRSLVVSDGLVVFRSREQATTSLVVERVSVGSGGIEGTGTAEPGLDSVSADGRFVVFESAAPNLVPGDTNGVTDVFLRDRVTDITTRVSVGLGGAEADGASSDAVVSDDGMRIAFRSSAANLVTGDTNQLEDIFLRDVGLGTTVRLNVTSGGAEVRGLTSKPGISGDGRVVAFASLASDLVPDDTNGVADLFVRDVASGVTERVSLASDGAEGDGESTVPPNTPPPVSRDGRFVLFASTATNLVPADTNGVIDTFLRDRLTGQTERVNVASDGGEANAESYGASVSDDGRFVVFDSFASNLVAGDTNGLRDTFVRDRHDRLTLRESIAVDGTEADGFSVGAALSRDARFLVFASDARTLIPGDTAGLFSVLLRDRTTGLVARVSRRWDGQAAGGAIPSLALDAGQVVFEAGTPLAPEDTNGRLDAYLASADPADPVADLTGDGDSDDTVLQVLDGETGVRTVLCPADEVAVDGDTIAFLRPEAAGWAAGCPFGAGGDLDGDGDATDAVVHAWSRGGAIVNLGHAATAVALSGPWLAALLSERDDGAADRNGDGDLDDRVVGVHRLDAPPDAWTVIGHAADAVGISGDLIVFLMPEAAEGGQDFSGDGDADDHLLRVYDAAHDTLLDVMAPATDFVAGAHLVAFRSPEAAGPAATCDENADGDCADDVLEVFDGVSARRVSSGQAATPCRLEACDPREPYRVDGDTVKFLTLEGEQGASDLDGDGDASDLVLQLFNVRLALRQQGLVATNPEGLRTTRAAGRVLAGVVSTVAAVSAGICTNSGTACGTTAACRGGTCFVPPGGCILDLGTPCNPLQAGACGAARYCAPILGRPREGTCHEVQGPCRYDDDCTAPARCNDVDQRRQRLAGPLARTPEPGTLFVGTGHCVERTPTTCGTAADCPAGAFCDGEGVCGREHGPCRADGDCPRGTRCEADLVTTAAADSDGDELPDVLDNCPGTPNVDQADADADGVGDACDAAP